MQRRDAKATPISPHWNPSTVCSPTPATSSTSPRPFRRCLVDTRSESQAPMRRVLFQSQHPSSPYNAFSPRSTLSPLRNMTRPRSSSASTCSNAQQHLQQSQVESQQEGQFGGTNMLARSSVEEFTSTMPASTPSPPKNIIGSVFTPKFPSGSWFPFASPFGPLQLRFMTSLTSSRSDPSPESSDANTPASSATGLSTTTKRTQSGLSKVYYSCDSVASGTSAKTVNGGGIGYSRGKSIIDIGGGRVVHPRNPHGPQSSKNCPTTVSVRNIDRCLLQYDDKIRQGLKRAAEVTLPRLFERYSETVQKLGEEIVQRQMRMVGSMALPNARLQEHGQGHESNTKGDDEGEFGKVEARHGDIGGELEVRKKECLTIEEEQHHQSSKRARVQKDDAKNETKVVEDQTNSDKEDRVSMDGPLDLGDVIHLDIVDNNGESFTAPTDDNPWRDNCDSLQHSPKRIHAHESSHECLQDRVPMFVSLQEEQPTSPSKHIMKNNLIADTQVDLGISNNITLNLMCQQDTNTMDTMVAQTSDHEEPRAESDIGVDAERTHHKEITAATNTVTQASPAMLEYLRASDVAEETRASLKTTRIMHWSDQVRTNIYMLLDCCMDVKLYVEQQSIAASGSVPYQPSPASTTSTESPLSSASDSSHASVAAMKRMRPPHRIMLLQKLRSLIQEGDMALGKIESENAKRADMLKRKEMTISKAASSDSSSMQCTAMDEELKLLDEKQLFRLWFLAKELEMDCVQLLQMTRDVLV
ncbi:hypothetical protein BGZ51_004288 [Haplosporangium sp. Z 767]|nr:hypothetical protein BGZ50_002118 [Haplosporangium sp. Z 11]KAF9193055.1 hypothetical protein BGZ51_004288 [Haplosporangium sp. Z 767]